MRVRQAAKRTLGYPSERTEELAQALEGFLEGKIDDTFGILFLRDFTKQGTEVSEKKLGMYWLQLDSQQDSNHYGKEFEEMYFDTVFNFCLAYNREIIASLGFNPAKGRIFIQQIQGAEKEARRLKQFKWTMALVQYATQWAKGYGIPEAAITFEQAAHVDYETGEHYRKAAVRRGCPVTLMPHQGFMIYDVTARRCGFERQGNGNYFKSLGIT